LIKGASGSCTGGRGFILEPISSALTKVESSDSLTKISKVPVDIEVSEDPKTTSLGFSKSKASVVEVNTSNQTATRLRLTYGAL